MILIEMEKRNILQKTLIIGIAALFLGASLPLTGALEPTQTAHKSGSPDLQVEIVDGSRAIIRNTGTDEAENVKWEMGAKAPILIIGPNHEGTISSLDAGSEKIVQYDIEPVFGLGPLRITVGASADNDADGDTDVEMIGLLIGSTILVFP